jgi:hypothetical protein
VRTDTNAIQGRVRGNSNLVTYAAVAGAGPHHRTNAFNVLRFVDWLHWDLGLAEEGYHPTVKPSWLVPFEDLTDPPDIDLTPGGK